MNTNVAHPSIGGKTVLYFHCFVIFIDNNVLFVKVHDEFGNIEAIFFKDDNMGSSISHLRFY
jgi:hypothetical protein